MIAKFHFFIALATKMTLAKTSPKKNDQVGMGWSSSNQLIVVENKKILVNMPRSNVIEKLPFNFLQKALKPSFFQVLRVDVLRLLIEVINSS